MNKIKKISSLLVSSVLVISFAGCSRTITGNKDTNNGLNAFNSL